MKTLSIIAMSFQVSSIKVRKAVRKKRKWTKRRQYLLCWLQFMNLYHMQWSLHLASAAMHSKTRTMFAMSIVTNYENIIDWSMTFNWQPVNFKRLTIKLFKSLILNCFVSDVEHYSYCKYFSTNRTVDVWNSLPNEVALFSHYRRSNIRSPTWICKACLVSYLYLYFLYWWYV